MHPGGFIIIINLRSIFYMKHKFILSYSSPLRNLRIMCRDRLQSIRAPIYSLLKEAEAINGE